MPASFEEREERRAGGVGVAEHDLLQVASRRDHAAVRRVRQQRVEQGSGRLELGDGLEQRREADARHRLLACQVDETGLAGQHDDGEQVVHVVRHRDDVGLDHLRPVRVERGADGLHERQRRRRRVAEPLAVGGRRGTQQRTRGPQLLGEPLDALRALEVAVPGLADPGVEVGEGRMVLGGVLAHVHRGQPRPERDRGAQQATDGPVAGQVVAGRQHRVAHEREVAHQLVEAEVVATGLVRGVVDETVAGAQQPHAHEAQLETVGLVGIEATDRAPRDRQRLGVLREAVEQLLAGLDHARRRGHLGEQVVDHRHQLGEPRRVLQVQHVERDLRRDVRVAVAVAAGPRAEAQRSGRRRQLDADARGLPVELVEQARHDLRRDRAQVVDGGTRLVERLGLDDPQLVGLPQQVDQLGQTSLVGRGVRGGATRVLEVAHDLGDLAQQPQHRAPARLGGVGGEHGAVLHAGEHVGQLLGRQAAVGEGLLDAPEGARERALAAQRQLLPAVQLLGDVDQLEVQGERPGQHHGALGLQAVERLTQLARPRAGPSREVPHPLHQLEQLRALVAGERLAQQRRQLSHRRPQRRVLLVGTDPSGEEGDVGLTAVGREDLLGRPGAGGGHGTILPSRGFSRVTPVRRTDE
ncbi:hypothetical protein QE370_000727 [Aeromicrobium sp. SORGH_AS981]|nr:hypothetical protein [Aeromicrobium sp. SORGH_AS_0981]